MNMVREHMASFLRYFILWIGCIVVTATSYAATPLIVHTKKHHNYFRMEFRGDNAVPFKHVLKEKELHLTFDEAVSLDFTKVMTELQPYMSKASFQPESKEVILTLKEPHVKIRSFISDKFTGLDLVMPKPSRKNKPITIVKGTTVKDQVDTFEHPMIEAEQLFRISAETPPPEMPNQPLRFPFASETAAAIFTRGDGLWIIFDYPLDQDPVRLLEYRSDWFTKVDDLSNPDYTIYRFQMKHPLFIHAHQEGFSWVVNLQDSPFNNAVTHPLVPIYQFKHALDPHLFFSGHIFATPLQVVDPIIGDNMVIVPTMTEGYGVTESRSIVDYSLLPTAAGIAIPIISDAVRVKNASQGIKIISPIASTFHNYIEDKKNAIHPKAKKKVKKVTSIFPFNKWQGSQNIAFVERQHALFYRLTFAPKSQRASVLMQLARFYTAHGMYQEGLVSLSMLALEQPEFGKTNRFKLQQALLYFLDKHYEQAAKIFPTIDKHAFSGDAIQEISIWEQASLIQAHEDAIFTLTPYHLQLLATYPADIRHTIMLIAIKDAIDRNEMETVVALVQQMEGEPLSPHTKHSLTFYKASSYAKMDQLPQALELFNIIYQDVDAPYHRAKAGLAITQLQLKHEKISQNEAIESLERLRMIWRGDNLEIAILKQLGDLYIAEKEYGKGLRIYRQIVSNFPKNNEILTIAKQMTAIFTNLFHYTKGTDISDLKNLALFYEFKELTPIGKAGDKMVLALASRLFQLDLLDRCAALLTHQVRYRLKGLPRAETATRLALIHLLNNKPDLAISALDATDHIVMPSSYETRRTYLRTQALIANKRFEEALTLIAKDTSRDALQLRIDIYWQQQKWQPLIDQLVPLYQRKQVSNLILSDNDSQFLAQLAVALAATNQTQQLQQLYKAFATRFPTNQYKTIFETIAGQSLPIDGRNYTKTVGRQAFSTLLDHYKKSAIELGLDATLNPKNG